MLCAQFLGGKSMRKAASILLVMIVALSAPAFADDADLKKQVDEIAAAYSESYNKQDMAGITALYATGGILVNSAGVWASTDIAPIYERAFKAGLSQLVATVDQVWPLGSDTAVVVGKFRFTGKNQSGAPIEAAGRWTATNVREGGKWKIRMQTAIPLPPPAAK
jgi:ketosteroid isomerase-like protein